MEKLCERMTEQAVASHEEMRARMMDIEDRHVMITRHLEAQLSGGNATKKTGTIGTEENNQTASLLASALSGTNYERESVKAMEKRIGKKLADSVDQLGDIIKQYARQ